MTATETDLFDIEPEEPKSAALVVSDEVAAFVKRLERVASKYLSETYRGKLGQFFEFLRAYDKPFSEDSIRLFLEMKERHGFADGAGRHRNYKAEGINGHVFAIKALLRAVIDHANLDGNVERAVKSWLADLKPVKVAKEKKQVGEDKVLSPPEIRDLVAGAKSEKDKLFILFLAAGGCRISEALGVRLGDIERLNGYCAVTIRGKGNKERDLKIRTALVDRITAHFHGSEYLFETAGGKPYRPAYVYDRIKKAGEETLGRKVYPHMLRHSFASEMLRKYPGDLAGISAYLGHASISTTTNAYVHGKISFEKLSGYHDEIEGESE